MAAAASQRMSTPEGFKLYIVQLETPKYPSGHSCERALRRLRKDRPDLHARVLSDELSPHAAMVEAGFRRRPTAFYDALGRRGGLKGGRTRAEKLTPEQRREIARKAAVARWAKQDA